MLPQSWLNWILQNLLKGVDANVLLNTLLDKGFNFEDCKKALGSNVKNTISVTKNVAFYTSLAAPRLLDNLDSMQAQYLVHEQAQLIKIDGFLTPVNCLALMALVKRKLRPSTITEPLGHDGFRTSTTCDLSHVEDALVKTLEDKIVQTLGVDIASGEPIQAQHYGVGQQFKAHTDYFEPGTNEYERFAKTRGQRTWTFMIYLDQNCKGGETEFPHLGLSFRPTQGTALIWNNLLPSGHPNPNTLHQSHPIISGEKMVVTKWFRDQ